MIHGLLLLFEAFVLVFIGDRKILRFFGVSLFFGFIYALFFKKARLHYVYYKRKNFVKLLEMVEQGEVSEIVIAHKDQLVRFGFEWFDKFAKDHGVKIVVMNADSLDLLHNF
jgi:hypothetical protein